MQLAADIVRSRKHNQSSLQIAANSIIENNNNRPSIIGASGQGLPPKGNEMSKRTYDPTAIGMGFNGGNQ
jgi:hypothetical protein